MKLLVVKFLKPPVTSSFLDTNILLQALFSNTANLLFSLRVRGQASYQYKTPHKITVLCILYLHFHLDSLPIPFDTIQNLINLAWSDDQMRRFASFMQRTGY
jgi:hypothetical protein